MKRRLLPIAPLLFLLLFAQALPALGADCTPVNAPLSVKVGVFVSSLYDLDLINKSYTAEFWVWFVIPEGMMKTYQPQDTTDIVNAKFSHRDFYFDESKAGYRWVTVKHNAVMIHNWDMSNFPFDRQLLRIDIEETDLDGAMLAFIPDRENSGADSGIKIPGWEVDTFSIESRTRVDETTYGDPTLSAVSTYPQTIVTITLKRHGTRLLFNLLTAAYIAFILGILVLFLHPEYVDSRKVLITSAMITIIGNHFAISTALPAVPAFTLIDKVMITTFTAICLIAVVSVVTTHYVRKGRTETAVTIDKAGRWTILFVYLALNAFFYIQALA